MAASAIRKYSKAKQNEKASIADGEYCGVAVNRQQ